ncbi:MAG: (Fe-S)-binding protein [candidate division WOR-3 bacterium]
MAKLLVPDSEIRDLIIEYGGSEALKCYQCGMCMALCPWYQLEKVDFLVYRLPQAVKLGAVLNTEDKDEVAAEVTELYRCVGCEACLARCPRGVDIPAVLRAIRRILVENQSVPQALGATIHHCYSTGNPLGGAPEERFAWAKGLDVPTFEKGVDFAWFSCCTADYDPRCQAVSRALVRVLRHAKVSFGVLGTGQMCCGEALRKAGAEEVFTHLAGANTALVDRPEVRRLLFTSPHCFNGFRRDYPDLARNRELVHETQLFDRLITEGRIRPKKELTAKVTYHDPCTLGRQCGIYEEPRRVLSSIPGVELVEIPDFNREQSVCCGGGGGGLWLDWPKGERLSDIRVRQAARTGAKVLAVACPYCLQMFEDSVKTMELDLRVADVAELLADSLED